LGEEESARRPKLADNGKKWKGGRGFELKGVRSGARRRGRPGMVTQSDTLNDKMTCREKDKYPPRKGGTAKRKKKSLQRAICYCSNMCPGKRLGGGARAYKKEPRRELGGCTGGCQLIGSKRSENKKKPNPPGT